MPFVDHANNFLVNAGHLSDHKRLPEMRETVRFMLANAVGVGNAIPAKRIVGHLQDTGHNTASKEDWQIGVLGPLRKNGIFIGSKRAKGMFIIKDQGDAKVVISQIEDRIQEEKDRLLILKQMVVNVGWEIQQ